MVDAVREVHLDMSATMGDTVLARESHGRTAHHLYLQGKNSSPASNLRVQHLLSRSSRSIGQFVQVGIVLDIPVTVGH